VGKDKLESKKEVVEDSQEVSVIKLVQPYHSVYFLHRAVRHLLTTTLSIRHILENQTTIVTAACLDSGKTRVDAYFGEILVTFEKIEWTLKHGEKALRPERRPTNLLMCYKANEVRWEPLGVVAAAVSWK
jgi:hypothetical protein